MHLLCLLHFVVSACTACLGADHETVAPKDAPIPQRSRSFKSLLTSESAQRIPYLPARFNAMAERAKVMALKRAFGGATAHVKDATHVIARLSHTFEFVHPGQTDTPSMLIFPGKAANRSRKSY